MLPAKVPVTDPRYGGPILLNPGGPGGSGVDLVTARGLAIQTIVDSPIDPGSESPETSAAKYYDVVGFDPRGIGQTVPGAHCFQAASIRESWNLRLDSQGILGSSDAVLGRRWSMVNALGASCAGLAEEGDVKHYVTTASVARDMLELAELFGQYPDLEAKAKAILAKMYHNPIQVKGEFPEVVTWSDVRLFMFMALYEPLHAFPLMAEMLAAMSRGDEDGEMERYLTGKHFFACAASGNDTNVAQVDGEASMAIMCSDGDPQDYLDIDGMDEHWRKLDAISPTVGAMWAGHRMNCAGWTIRPKYRFTDYKPEFGGNTSNPILWVGNTADPVTPLVNAHKMKSLFPGSEVLAQNSPGLDL
ncbi:putative alpha beta hydrolase fold-1 protein [Neofusicoccum parvum UCRNP2]|uniref:Putative alpha beta hydrolase fold-1 protein n=1 Tax=Botryosphaeria parva (strain UCR-NP2) TaxID=1287680 RepID=R1G6S4_BOTPV|nr:putative alpha beta hydrolase fold-1 protein [Neofusicoccum parvum UCRNP2]